jgi:hypothetical protein
MTNRAPLFAAILVLIAPLLYVGAYLSLVVPDRDRVDCFGNDLGLPDFRTDHKLVWAFFWPLEQIDRKLRPREWMEPHARSSVVDPSALLAKFPAL